MFKTHGASRSNEYTIFLSMLSRCNNPKFVNYRNYGGRGIKVCDEWNCGSKFPAFIAYMGKRPSPKHSIDRIDNNGNYEPGNVRWVTQMEQSRNTRVNRLFTISGVTLCVTDWAKKYNISVLVVWARLRRGMAILDALNAPIKVVNLHLTREQRRERNQLLQLKWRLANPERVVAHRKAHELRRRAMLLAAGNMILAPKPAIPPSATSNG